MIGIDELTVDLEALFDRYGLDNVTEVGADELAANCPFHEGDEHHHFSMNRETGLFNCFVCSEHGNIVQFIERMDNRGPSDAKRVLAGLSVDEISSLGVKIQDSLDRLVMGGPSDEPTAYIPYEMCLHQYLAKRGFTEESARAWELGWSKYQSRVVIPARNEDGRMLGYILRAPDQSTRPKYLYTEGKWKSRLLFGYARAGRIVEEKGLAVLVTEGSLDAIWLWQMGQPAVAVLGSSISDRQVALLAGFLKVILMLDGDKAGMDATFGKGGVGERLMDAGVTVECVRYPEGRKDPQECSEGDVRSMLADTRSLVSLRMRMQELSKR